MDKIQELAKLVASIKMFLQEENSKGVREILCPSSNASPLGELSRLAKSVENCHKCDLGKTRKNIVFGEGNPSAQLMFVGEGPGFDEDRLGFPFVGKAGQLLTRIIESKGLRRKDVYITNIVKCHPMRDPEHPEKRGNDRPPTVEEVMECIPILFKQIAIIKPKVICTLGAPATKAILKLKEGIARLRGNLYNFYPPYGEFKEPVKVMPTYHPAYLLRDPSKEVEFLEDIEKIRALLGKREE